MSKTYTLLQAGPPFLARAHEHGNQELRRLTQFLPHMRFGPTGVLEVELVFHGRRQWNTVCPPIWRKGVIQEAHALAHAGINRTLARIQLSWYWPGMTSDVRSHVHCCEPCQKGKNGGLLPSQDHRRMHTGRPWQQLALDLVGPLPTTDRGNQWILVLTDHFSRWQDALALPDATAPTVVTHLEERVFCYFGLSEQIYTDQGI